MRPIARRTWGPPFQQMQGERVAAYFVGINRNKRVMRLDLTTDDGRAVLRALLAEADVLLENFKSGTLDGWGLGHDVIARDFPRLTLCGERASVTFEARAPSWTQRLKHAFAAPRGRGRAVLESL